MNFITLLVIPLALAMAHLVPSYSQIVNKANSDRYRCSLDKSVHPYYINLTMVKCSNLLNATDLTVVQSLQTHAL